MREKRELNCIQEKVLQDYYTFNQTAKSFSARAGELKSGVVEIVKECGYDATDKTVRVELSVPLGESSTETKKVKFDVTTRESVVIKEDFSDQVRESPEMMGAISYHLNMPFIQIKGIAKRLAMVSGITDEVELEKKIKEELDNLMSFRTGMSLDTDKYELLVSEGKIKNPGAIFKTVTSESFSVK